jgi:hypothetical protein
LQNCSNYRTRVPNLIQLFYYIYYLFASSFIPFFINSLLPRAFHYITCILWFYILFGFRVFFSAPSLREIHIEFPFASCSILFVCPRCFIRIVPLSNLPFVFFYFGFTILPHYFYTHHHHRFESLYSSLLFSTIRSKNFFSVS